MQDNQKKEIVIRKSTICGYLLAYKAAMKFKIFRYKKRNIFYRK